MCREKFGSFSNVSRGGGAGGRLDNMTWPFWQHKVNRGWEMLLLLIFSPNHIVALQWVHETIFPMNDHRSVNFLCGLEFRVVGGGWCWLCRLVVFAAARDMANCNALASAWYRSRSCIYRVVVSSWLRRVNTLHLALSRASLFCKPFSILWLIGGSLSSNILPLYLFCRDRGAE